MSSSRLDAGPNDATDPIACMPSHKDTMLVSSLTLLVELFSLRCLQTRVQFYWLLCLWLCLWFGQRKTYTLVPLLLIRHSTSVGGSGVGLEVRVHVGHNRTTRSLLLHIFCHSVHQLPSVVQDLLSRSRVKRHSHGLCQPCTVLVQMAAFRVLL